MELHQCPCCDYFTLEEPHAWEICHICFWEDDGIYLDRPDFGSGANHGMTLRQARENFRLLGACEATMLENVLPASERGKFKREVRQIEE
jgi:Cysteine-rich CPCC